MLLIARNAKQVLGQQAHHSTSPAMECVITGYRLGNGDVRFRIRRLPIEGDTELGLTVKTCWTPSIPGTTDPAAPRPLLIRRKSQLMRRGLTVCSSGRSIGRVKPPWCAYSRKEGGLLTLGAVATDDEGGLIGYAAYCSV
ncbi:MAG: hypothetical protein GPOALKHO_001446 [Sodalis sp.]|nr:MAG: hypothetical protein GPOALKHO_001446 [Sodalis sp.]